MDTDALGMLTPTPAGRPDATESEYVQRGLGPDTPQCPSVRPCRATAYGLLVESTAAMAWAIARLFKKGAFMIFRTFSFGVGVAVALLTSTALAQDAKSPILNSLELRQAVASEAPSDQARLAAHYTALAEKYAASAKRHASMAAALTSSRNPGPSVHCKQLATLDGRLEAAARELAAFHVKVGQGAAGASPSHPGGLGTGTGARKPTDEELEAFAEKASKTGDHRALMDYFSTLSQRYTADAEAHSALAAAYRSTKSMAGMAVHCERLAALAKEAAKEARAAADMHQTQGAAPR